MYGAASVLIGSILMTSQAAAGQVWVQDPYGGWELVNTGPEPALLFVTLIVGGIAFIICCMLASDESSDTPPSYCMSNLPAEIANPQSVEYYDDQVPRVRACTQLLDAEAEHARRYIDGKSALDAVGKARQRCWRYAWVLDLDIQNFFDRIDINLLMRAVRKHTDCPWVLLYIERWLKAPVQMADGSLVARERGTPQGGVISPILSNLFLHYAFDIWMARNHPTIPFERYADDAICHCRSEAEARALLTRLETRFAECGLTLHPDKTKIVYCKDDDRRGNFPDHKFDFLGYTFRPRLSRRRTGFGVSFSPAASGEALKSIRQTVRHWKLHQRSDKTLDDLARMFNNHIRGWINYYGRFYKSALYPTLRRIDLILARWAHRKFKSLRRHKRRTYHWLSHIVRRQPDLFAHWRLLYGRGRAMGAG